MEGLEKMRTSLSGLSEGKHHERVVDAFMSIVFALVPIWLSVLVGLIVGWSWRPRWVSLLFVALRWRPRLASTIFRLPVPLLLTGFNAQRLWIAVTAAVAVPAFKDMCSSLWTWLHRHRRYMSHVQYMPPATLSSVSPAVIPRVQEEVQDTASVDDIRLVHGGEGGPDCGCGWEQHGILLSSVDLKELCCRIDGNDGGPAWSLFMDKVIPGMTYTAWRRDPENGPTEYRSRTVVSNCTAQLMRDFFWDDEFRISSKWDDMLVHSQVVDECHVTGQQIVQWIRKFPFFCKDREYIIARRIWSFENVYYCITKGVDHPAFPPRDQPKRVPLFYSCWRIKEELDGSSEILLFHSEEMGIQRHLAKMGIRQGMWPAVRKIEPGIRTYQQQRAALPSAPLSRSASMANIHTPISPNRPGMARIWHSLSDLTLLPRTESSGLNQSPGGLMARDGEGEVSPVTVGEQEVTEESMAMVRNPRSPVQSFVNGKLGLWMVAGITAMACGLSPTIVCNVFLAGAARKVVASRWRRWRR